MTVQGKEKDILNNEIECRWFIEQRDIPIIATRRHSTPS
jgi:hypothetical protein